MQQRLVGVFDSGIGGLSVARQIKSIIPETSLVYVSDSDFAPYGDKSQPQILERCIEISTWLKNTGVEVVVVACNTATVSTINQLRKLIDVPFVGVEPGIKPAVKQSQDKNIGVLATSQTAASCWFKGAVQNLRQDCQIHVQACPGLAEQVESLDLGLSEQLVRYLDNLIDKQVDQIVLGCTHYSFLSSAIEQYLSSNVTLVDTGEAVAKQLKRILNLTPKSSSMGEVLGDSVVDRFYSTGEVSHYNGQLKVLWSERGIIGQTLTLGSDADANSTTSPKVA